MKCVSVCMCVCLEIGLCCVAQAYYPASVSHSYDGRMDGQTDTHTLHATDIYG